MKQCSGCKEIKPFAEFSPREGGRYKSKCKPCRCVDNVRWTQRNAEKVKVAGAQYTASDRGRNASLLRKYNITLDQYNEMLELQNGVCAACKRPETSVSQNGNVKPLSVDHDHRCCPERAKSCGRCVRGLLCTNCNIILGHAKDSGDRLWDLFFYLQDYAWNALKEERGPWLRPLPKT